MKSVKELSGNNPDQAQRIPWFESPLFDEELEKRKLDPLTHQKMIQMHEEGFCIIDLGIDPDILDGAIADVEGKYVTEGRLNEQRRVQDAWRFSKNIRALATNPKVMDFLQTLYDRRPIPFQTLNFEIGTEQKTHSDVIHFHCVPYRYMCGVWIALEDVDEQNGPLHYYPGSHNLPVWEMAELGIRSLDSKKPYHHYGHYEDHVVKLVEELGLERKTLKFKKGQALVWAANLFHGGSEILDKSRTRKSQVTHYYFEDCLYYSPLLTSFLDNQIFVRNPYDITIGRPLPYTRLRKCASQAGFGGLKFDWLYFKTQAQIYLTKIRSKLGLEN